MTGFSFKAVKNALEMASAAIESKQKAIDSLQIELEDYKERLERYIQMNREAQELAYGVDQLQHSTDVQRHDDDPREFFQPAHDKSIVVILQETLDELHACKATIQEQEERLEVLDMLPKNGHQGKENRLSDGTAGTNALYEKLLKEKDDTIAELALLLASREQSLRDAFAQAVITSSLPTSPRSDA